VINGAETRATISSIEEWQASNASNVNSFGGRGSNPIEFRNFTVKHQFNSAVCTCYGKENQASEMSEIVSQSSLLLADLPARTFRILTTSEFFLIFSRNSPFSHFSEFPQELIL
jgi:hypothetical protein